MNEVKVDVAALALAHQQGAQGKHSPKFNFPQVKTTTHSSPHSSKLFWMDLLDASLPRLYLSFVSKKSSEREMEGWLLRKALKALPAGRSFSYHSAVSWDRM